MQMYYCTIHKACHFLHRFVGCNKLKLVHLRLKMRRKKMCRTLLLLTLARLVSTISHLPLSQLYPCAGVNCHGPFLPECAVSITVCPAAAKLNAAVLVPATIEDYSLGDMPSSLLTHFEAYCILQYPQNVDFAVHCLQMHCATTGQAGFINLNSVSCCRVAV